MVPTLVHVGRWGLPTHDVFTALGVFVAFLVFVWEARHRGRLDERLAIVAAGCLLGAGLGARAAFVWRYVSVAPAPTVQGFLVQGGKSVVGGLAGAYAGAVLAKRMIGYREKTGDLFAPAVASGMAVGRIGCFLTEAPGTPTTLPWGIRLNATQIASIPNCTRCVQGIAYHPSILYEIVFLLALAVALFWLRPRLSVPGELFTVFLLSYAIFRFGIEFVRGNPTMAFGLSGTQLFLVPSTVLLTAALYRGRRPARRASSAMREGSI